MKLKVKNLIYLTLYKALINPITNHKFWQEFEKKCDMVWMQNHASKVLFI